MTIPLTDLDIGESAIIATLEGGKVFQRKVRSIGIREDKVITVRAKHPFGGPIVLEIDHRQSTIGRVMAEHIMVNKQPTDSGDS